MRHRRALLTDISSLSARPWVAEVRDLAIARRARSSGLRQGQPRVLDELDRCLTDARINKLLDWVAFTSTHPSIYVLVEDVEAFMDAERSRVERCGNLVALLVAPSELAVLDGHVTAEALGRAIDTASKTEVQAAIGEVLEALERRLEADPGPTIVRILDMAELAARKHLLQKLLLLFLAVGVPPKQLRSLDPGVLMGALALLAAMPVPLVAGLAALLAPLAAVGAAKPSGTAQQSGQVA